MWLFVERAIDEAGASSPGTTRIASGCAGRPNPPLLALIRASRLSHHGAPNRDRGDALFERTDPVGPTPCPLRMSPA